MLKKLFPPAIFPKGIKILFLIIAIEFFALGLTDTYQSLFFSAIIENYFLIGILVGSMQLMMFFSSAYFARKIESESLVYVFVTSRFFVVFALLFFSLGGVLEHQILLVFSALLFGIGMGGREVAVRDYLIEHTNKEHAQIIYGTNLSLRNMAWSFSAIFSGFLILKISEFFSTSFELGVGFLFFLQALIFLSSFFLYFKLPYKNNCSSSDRKQIKNTEQVSYFSELKILKKSFLELSIALKFSLFLIFFFRLVSGTTMLFLPLLILEFNLIPVYMGVIFAIWNMPLVLSALFSVFEDHHDRMICIIIGLFSLSVPLFLLSQTNTPLWIAFFATLTSFSFAFIHPANLGLIAAQVQEKDAAKISGLQVFFDKFGWFVGAMGLGYVAERWGIQAAFLVTSGISILFMVIAIWIKFQFPKIRFLKKHEQKHHLHFHGHH